MIIYLITNIINNKRYIGQTVNPKKRWNRHKWDSINGSDCKIHVRNFLIITATFPYMLCHIQ